jgi:hypothetical protein
MTTGPRFNPPPAPSLPQNAPWTDAQLIESYLYAIVQALQAGGTLPSTPTSPVGTGTVTPSPGGATLDDVLTALNRLIAIETNAPAIQTFDVPVTTPNQQIQFTAMTIPDGFDLLVESHPQNDPTGLIKIAPKNGNLDYNVVLLQPGQFMRYRVQSTDALYIAGIIVGDKVILTCEKK